MALRALSSGTISFGLVSIPVKFFTAASSEQVRFNMLHKDCGARLKQQMVCSVHGDVVSREQTLRGYEYQKGEFVTLDDEELKALEAGRDSHISITEFVALTAFDMVQVERSYYLGPDKGGDKAYRLLSEAMHESGKVAVGSWAARGKEQLVVIRPYKDGLIFHQMYFADEVRAFDEVDTGATFKFSDVERKLAHQLIDQLTESKFEWAKYEDTYRKRVTDAVEQKVAGKQVQLAPEAPRAQIIDLFEALKQSLAVSADGNDRPIPVKKAAGDDVEAPKKRTRKAGA
jgi:DNA end-binding protein Ku